MGGVVWSDGLRAVSEQDGETVDELLRSLGRKEFLRRDRRSAVLGATQHAFVHTLVRDAVYGQLPRPDRVERHVRVAHWIESLPDDRREDRAELLAHHYIEAIELARSAGLDVGRARAKAAAPCARSGCARSPSARSRGGARSAPPPMAPGGARRACAAGARQGVELHGARAWRSCSSRSTG